MELQRQRARPEGEGLIGEFAAALRQQPRAARQLEAVAVPMIDAARERRGAQKVRVRRRGQRVIADFAALVGIGEHPDADWRASICAPGRRAAAYPRSSGTASQSISRRTQSSSSLALIGPPNTIAPAAPASVAGSGFAVFARGPPPRFRFR